MRTCTWVKQAIVAVLIGAVGGGAAQGQDPQIEEARRPTGAVRTDRRAVADSKGPFNALGATLFWGAWGYKFDRARLERNLESLREAGVDYVRVLGSVGGNGWEDRESDPQWPDYDEVIAGLTDLAYDRYGLRVQWTIFGGSPETPAGRARNALVDRFARLAKGREHKIFAFEIGNEARSNGFEGDDGIVELRQLGARLSARTSVLVALSAPGGGDACATYAGAAANAATIHYDRSLGPDGVLAPLSRPWGYPRQYDRECRGRLPAVVFNNEPIGPESSVRSDDDPGRIAAGYVMTFLAGNASYVFHAGPGIRGGGSADANSDLRRHANFDEMPSFESIADALSAARRYLPRGLANWTRQEPGAPSAPVRGAADIYSATSGRRFVALVIGTGVAMSLTSRVNASIEVRDPANGKVVQRLQVKPGERFRLNDYELLVLIGRA